jgi:predicted ATPase
MDSVLGLLRIPKVRLVSLAGPGGMGKTRLAVATAAALQEAEGLESFFVDLVSLRDPALVESAIARALGVQGDEQEAIAAGLERTLRLRHVLLLLDNSSRCCQRRPC